MSGIHIGNDLFVGTGRVSQASRAALWYEPYQRTRTNYRCCNGRCYCYALLACQTSIVFVSSNKKDINIYPRKIMFGKNESKGTGTAICRQNKLSQEPDSRSCDNSGAASGRKFGA